MDLAEFDYYLVASGSAFLAALFPCKPPFLSAIFCHGSHFDLDFTKRCLFPIFEFVSAAGIVIGEGYQATMILVPCLSFLLTELNRIYAFAAGISEYRKLQVLEKIMNSMIRKRIFAVNGYVFPFVQMMLCFIAIKLFQVPDVNILRGGMFLLSYFGVLAFTLVTFSVAGNVIRISSRWILGYKGRCKSSVGKRLYWSLVPLRVQFGNNFVEPLTPLVVQEFCIRQTASLLLLSK